MPIPGGEITSSEIWVAPTEPEILTTIPGTEEIVEKASEYLDETLKEETE